MNKKINIELTTDELLVLSDLVYRINSKRCLEEFFEDQSEQRVLWDLESQLEKK